MTTNEHLHWRPVVSDDMSYLASCWVHESRGNLRKDVSMGWETALFNAAWSHYRSAGPSARMEVLCDRQTDLIAAWWCGELWDKWCIVDHLSVRRKLRCLGLATQTYTDRIKPWADGRRLAHTQLTYGPEKRLWQQKVDPKRTWYHVPYLRTRFLDRQWYDAHLVTYQEQVAATRWAQ